MAARHDYYTLEQEFISGAMSIRELCRRHRIKNPSPVHDRAKRDDWYAKREAFRQKANERTIGHFASAAARRAERRGAIVDHAIETMERFLTRADETLAAVRVVDCNGVRVEEPLVWVKPAEVARAFEAFDKLMDKLLPEPVWTAATPPRMASPEPVDLTPLVERFIARARQGEGAS
jgi:hypothetical protein